MVLTDEQKIAYYRNRQLARRVVLEEAMRKRQIIFGARAINAHLPAHLDRTTEDFDIYTNKNPKEVASQVEQKLDRIYGGDFFSIKEAQKPGTWKVKSNVTKRTIADYSKIPGKIPTTNIVGNDYASLNHLRESIKKTLRTPGSEFRRKKDVEALQRINLFQEIKKVFGV